MRRCELFLNLIAVRAKSSWLEAINVGQKTEITMLGLYIYNLETEIVIKDISYTRRTGPFFPYLSGIMSGDHGGKKGPIYSIGGIIALHTYVPTNPGSNSHVYKCK